MFKLYYAPGKNDAWEPDRLEYRFACSAPEGTHEKVLASEEFYQGHLDWYNLDVDSKSQGLGRTAGARLRAVEGAFRSGSPYSGGDRCATMRRDRRRGPSGRSPWPSTIAGQHRTARL